MESRNAGQNEESPFSQCKKSVLVRNDIWESEPWVEIPRPPAGGLGMTNGMFGDNRRRFLTTFGMTSGMLG